LLGGVSWLDAVLDLLLLLFELRTLFVALEVNIGSVVAIAAVDVGVTIAVMRAAISAERLSSITPPRSYLVEKSVYMFVGRKSLSFNVYERWGVFLHQRTTGNSTRVLFFKTDASLVLLRCPRLAPPLYFHLSLLNIIVHHVHLLSYFADLADRVCCVADRGFSAPAHFL
jgi:hypothetical protein